MRNNPEHRIHTKAVAYLRKSFARKGFGRRECPFFHTANESDVPPSYRAKLARLGVSPGVPDLIIVSPTSPASYVDVIGGVSFPGAALEIKAPKGRLTADQRRWLDTWRSAGFAAEWTRGHVATAHQLHVWGYIDSKDRDQWVSWAKTNDEDAA